MVTLGYCSLSGWSRECGPHYSNVSIMHLSESEVTPAGTGLVTLLVTFCRVAGVTCGGVWYGLCMFLCDLWSVHICGLEVWKHNACSVLDLSFRLIRFGLLVFVPLSVCCDG